MKTIIFKNADGEEVVGDYMVYDDIVWRVDFGSYSSDGSSIWNGDAVKTDLTWDVKEQNLKIVKT